MFFRAHALAICVACFLRWIVVVRSLAILLTRTSLVVTFCASLQLPTMIPPWNAWLDRWQLDVPGVRWISCVVHAATFRPSNAIAVLLFHFHCTFLSDISVQVKGQSFPFEVQTRANRYTYYRILLFYKWSKWYWSQELIKFSSQTIEHVHLRFSHEHIWQ